jgi:hypothetical protein
MFRSFPLTRRITRLLAVVLTLVLVCSGSTAADTPSYGVASVSAPGAAQPPLIAYQGRLLNPATGDPKPDAPYSATFRLYSVETGGTALWTETQSIVTSKGFFSVTLGNQTGGSIDPALFDGSARWLGISISPDSELSPRIRLASAPYAIWANTALNASNAETLDGRHFDAFADAGHTHLGQTWHQSANASGLILEGTVGWSNSLLYSYNHSNGPSIWGVNDGGGNAVRGQGSGNSLGVYGQAENEAGVAGRSSGFDGVVGMSSASGRSGVYGVNEGTGYGVFGVAAVGPGVHGTDGGENPDDSWAVEADGDMRTSGDLNVALTLYVGGYATFAGGKSGFVVDIAQNDDTESLLPGDVVSISGARPAVVGEIPVIKVRRATTATGTGVIGVVDARFTLTRRAAAGEAAAEEASDARMKVESAIEAVPVGPGQYLTVVTLGAYKTIKVEATHGAISPGDLLVASANPGYATNSAAPLPGTIIGKSLGSLAEGTGEVPVLVTLQ